MTKRTKATKETTSKAAPKKKITGELAATLADANKRYGAGTATAASVNLQPDRISTGVFIMDLATLGGIPVNRGTMIVGEKHGGKTMMASLITANAQRLMPDQRVVYIDLEGTYDSTWAAKCGVDTESLVLARCETGEMAVDIVDGVLSSKETSLVVIDSLAALRPTREADSSAEDAHVGLQSRLVGSMIRKMTGGMVAERKRDHKVTCLYINQFRTKIGGFSPHGDPRTVPGGKALEYSTSLQMIIKNKENKGRDSFGVETMSHNTHPYTITKNKMCGGPRTGEFAMTRDSEYAANMREGQIDNAPTLLSFAKKFGLYTGAGANQKLEFDDVSFKFGKQDQCIDMLREDHGLQQALWWTLVATQAQHLGMPDEFVNRVLHYINPYSE